ncbi:hypothetical protein HGRIS_011006 [Hohenbuehelia grisea]|uniref:Uncharacterized protein n=1 Tax=Hohenbuehelia grisea TaxID=104357 RepID=A0ABR3IYI4_9AGAR
MFAMLARCCILQPIALLISALPQLRPSHTASNPSMQQATPPSAPRTEHATLRTEASRRVLRKLYEIPRAPVTTCHCGNLENFRDPEPLDSEPIIVEKSDACEEILNESNSPRTSETSAGNDQGSRVYNGLRTSNSSSSSSLSSGDSSPIEDVRFLDDFSSLENQTRTTLDFTIPSTFTSTDNISSYNSSEFLHSAHAFCDRKILAGVIEDDLGGLSVVFQDGRTVDVAPLNRGNDDGLSPRPLGPPPLSSNGRGRAGTIRTDGLGIMAPSSDTSSTS